MPRPKPIEQLILDDGWALEEVDGEAWPANPDGGEPSEVRAVEYEDGWGIEEPTIGIVPTHALAPAHQPVVDEPEDDWSDTVVTPQDERLRFTTEDDAFFSAGDELQSSPAMSSGELALHGDELQTPPATPSGEFAPRGVEPVRSGHLSGVGTWWRTRQRAVVAFVRRIGAGVARLWRRAVGAVTNRGSKI